MSDQRRLPSLDNVFMSSAFPGFLETPSLTSMAFLGDTVSSPFSSTIPLSPFSLLMSGGAHVADVTVDATVICSSTDEYCPLEKKRKELLSQPVLKREQNKASNKKCKQAREDENKQLQAEMAEFQKNIDEMNKEITQSKSENETLEIRNAEMTLRINKKAI